jgi:hypothetical protein
LCFTKNGFVICSGVQHNIVAASDKLSDVSGSNYDYRKLKAYVVHPSGRPTADFKLLGGAYGSSGSVCHQTSNIRLETLVSMTQDVVQRSKVPGNFLRHWKITNDRRKLIEQGKRSLCTLFEIALRTYAPDEIARPAFASRVFNQKGKRMN